MPDGIDLGAASDLCSARHGGAQGQSRGQVRRRGAHLRRRARGDPRAAAGAGDQAAGDSARRVLRRVAHDRPAGAAHASRTKASSRCATGASPSWRGRRPRMSRTCSPRAARSKRRSSSRWWRGSRSAEIAALRRARPRRGGRVPPRRPRRGAQAVARIPSPDRRAVRQSGARSATCPNWCCRPRSPWRCTSSPTASTRTPITSTCSMRSRKRDAQTRGAQDDRAPARTSSATSTSRRWPIRRRSRRFSASADARWRHRISSCGASGRRRIEYGMLISALRRQR